MTNSFWPNFDSGDVSIEEAAVVDLLGQAETLANRANDQRLDLSCRHAGH
jgi:hypothetical protein